MVQMLFEEMTRDYAKKVLGRPRSKTPKLIYITLVSSVVAVIISLFIYHYRLSNPISRKSTPMIQQPSSTMSKWDAHFEFYTLLTKMEVTNLPRSLVNHSGESLNHFTLQIASFKNIADAERLKSRLSLSFPVYIQTYWNGNGVIWNRVMVGPYPTLQEAKRARIALQAWSIDSLLLKGVP